MDTFSATPVNAPDPWDASDFRHPHSAMGAMTWLMQHADYHRRWNLHAMNVGIVPAIVLGQFRIYRTPVGEPIGFVTWAYVSEEVKDILIHCRRAMEWGDWNSGKLLMFNDFVAPFGHGRWMVNELRGNLFANSTAFSLKRGINGTVLKVFRWDGKELRRKAQLTRRHYVCTAPSLAIGQDHPANVGEVDNINLSQGVKNAHTDHID